MSKPRYKCYLICSSVALSKKDGAVQVSHYLGTTNQPITARLSEHVACGQNHTPHTERGEYCQYNAARITAAFVRAGGTLVVTRTWSGGHLTEQRIKAYGKLWRLCPACCQDAMKRKPKGMTKGRKI